MKMTQKQTLFVKGDVVCFVFNDLNYEATMTRTHYSSYKVYMLKNVKLMNGGNQMERANIKSSFITNIKKIHDDHTGEDIIMNVQPEEPIEEPTYEQPKDEPEQPEHQNVEQIKEPAQPKYEPEQLEQPNEQPDTNISDSPTHDSNVHEKIEKFLNISSNYREPLQNIIINMLDKYKTLNGYGIERHNFCNRPSKLNNIPEYYQMNEATLHEILENNTEKAIIEELGGNVQLGKMVHVCIIMWISLYIYKTPVLYISKNLESDTQLKQYINGVDEFSFNYQFIKIFFEDYLDLKEDFKKFKLPYFRKIEDMDIAYYHSKNAYNINNIDYCSMNYKQLSKIDQKFNEYLCINKELVDILVIVDDKKVKPSTSPAGDRCKTDNLLGNIYKKCRHVLFLSDTTTTTKQPDKSDEQIQPAVNDGSAEIAYKCKLLKKCPVESIHVCDKNRIIREYAIKHISFDEAKLKIKQIQTNELIENKCYILRKIIPEFCSLKNDKQKLKSNIIINKSEYDEKISIIQQYKDGIITYKDAHSKLEILRDTIKAKAKQPTRQKTKYYRLDHSEDLFTDV